MLRQCFCNFTLAGVSLTDYGLEIPSPFASLELTNSEIQSMTSWTLTCTVGGDSSRKMNIASFEGLIYQARSTVDQVSNVPVSFMVGWLENGKVVEYLTYKGWFINYSVTTSGMFMTYKLTGFAELAMHTSSPVFHIPEVEGYIQPSALVEALYRSLKLDLYYDLDIDHNDAPVFIHHSALTTSFNNYVRGVQTTDDNFNTFPGCIAYSKSYNMTRDSAGMKYGCSLTAIMNAVNSVDELGTYMKKSLTDSTAQCTSFSYWVDEPTTTSRGVIHYKSDAGLNGQYIGCALEYGTSNTNILSLSGSYNGIAYDMTNLGIRSVGFSLDASGNSISNDGSVVNSFASSLDNVYRTASIINDINAIASQFSASLSITIAGSTKGYEIAQPVSVIIMSGNTLSPISGIYNIKSVSHSVSNTFTTTFTLQRLQKSSANEVAVGQGILVGGESSFSYSRHVATSNIITPYYVDFGALYPTVEDIYRENFG